ncbi:ATP-dependent DNA helicase RecG [Hydrocarboniphaga sp.]|uniref:ATP-dependent DNA helicase RecG n=1 Tax=Hydrocarboniphaga sp. TaxID=2033016 RepID=UPI003D13D322
MLVFRTTALVTRAAKTPAQKPVAPDRVDLRTRLADWAAAGPQLAGVLRNLGLETIGDLLFHLPTRYQDRSHVTALADLTDGADALVRARVEIADVRYAGRRQLRVVIADGDRGLLLRFFHFNASQQAAFVKGRWVQAYGAVRFGTQGPEMVHPEYRVADDTAAFQISDALTPIYPLTAGITQPRLRRLIEAALKLAATDVHLAAQLPGLPAPDSLPALRSLHAPGGPDETALLVEGTHPAQQRLIREELLAHQLCMRLLRRQVRTRPAPQLADLNSSADALEAVLPFRFTQAQRRVIAEVGVDLAARRPMLRLVQGDVGSGKTVVAAAAMLAAARGGYQSALMAPTELLAEQHYANLSRWFAPLDIEVEYLAGKMKKSERERRLARVGSGAAPIVVGTHAVFQSSVAFDRLALVVVDEQHRFGVQQRLSLRDKGPKGTSPHQMIMSATPIPRTLAQTLYADLDVSVIDELPPGRTPVATVVVNNNKRDDVLARIGEAARAGRQVYWVCTLIEESDELDAQAAETTAEQLRADLPDLRIGLVHGRLKSDEKDAQMHAFKNGETQLLVATTVIEVGVDVPNASIMVIENAERLGLAQLHQLRGRVGRGATASQCVLMYQVPLSNTAKSRLETMRSTTDGFKIAQADLELRGPGEILGRRQTGVIGLKIAEPVRDSALIPPLQQLADDWLERYPLDAQRLIARWVGDVEKYGQV